MLLRDSNCHGFSDLGVEEITFLLNLVKDTFLGSEARVLVWVESPGMRKKKKHLYLQARGMMCASHTHVRIDGCSVIFWDPKVPASELVFLPYSSGTAPQLRGTVWVAVPSLAFTVCVTLTYLHGHCTSVALDINQGCNRQAGNSHDRAEQSIRLRVNIQKITTLICAHSKRWCHLFFSLQSLWYMCLWTWIGHPWSSGCLPWLVLLEPASTLRALTPLHVLTPGWPASQ